MVEHRLDSIAGVSHRATVNACTKPGIFALGNGLSLGNIDVQLGDDESAVTET